MPMCVVRLDQLWSWLGLKPWLGFKLAAGLTGLGLLLWGLFKPHPHVHSRTHAEGCSYIGEALFLTWAEGQRNEQNFMVSLGPEMGAQKWQCHFHISLSVVSRVDNCLSVNGKVNSSLSTGSYWKVNSK